MVVQKFCGYIGKFGLNGGIISICQSENALAWACYSFLRKSSRILW